MPAEKEINAPEQRTASRVALSVPFRLVCDRMSHTIDGETTDVSGKGIGVKFGRTGSRQVDALLEGLVEDRLSVDVVLRLPQGSVRAQGRMMWWGLLGDDDRFSIRAGILLDQRWSAADWELIEKNV